MNNIPAKSSDEVHAMKNESANTFCQEYVSTEAS